MAVVRTALVTEDDEHLSMCLVAICVSGEVSVHICCPFFFVLGYFLVTEFWEFCVCSDASSLVDTAYRDLISSCGLFFHSFSVFEEQKFLILMKFCLSVCYFMIVFPL